MAALCRKLRIEHQTFFISGVFSHNAALRKDEHSDFRTCIMIDILERFLQQINLHRNPLNRISYNVVSSTQARSISEVWMARTPTAIQCC